MIQAASIYLSGLVATMHLESCSCFASALLSFFSFFVFFIFFFSLLFFSRNSIPFFQACGRLLSLFDIFAGSILRTHSFSVVLCFLILFLVLLNRQDKKQTRRTRTDTRPFGYV